MTDKPKSKRLSPILTLCCCLGLWNSPLTFRAFSQSLPVTLGTATHVWNTLLGGGIWLPTRQAAKAHAAVFSEYPGSVLVNLKAPSHGFGYRFDLDYWEPSAPEYSWFAWDGTDAHEPTTLDELFQIYGRPNAKFILNIPLPKPNSAAFSYSWQTPEFYAAECQYLFGPANSSSVYSALPMSIDFFSKPANFNWANLRARRGRVQPYTAEAILLGEEPYHIEDWGPSDGGAFGAVAEKCRQLLRARGVTLPYGVHVNQQAPSDPTRQWFYPMMRALSPTDPPKYFDLYHYYSFVGTDDWLRSFSVSRKVDGFNFWWVPQSQWHTDYTRYLWLVPDTRLALAQAGLNYNNYKLGFSEHGMTLSSAFKFNDLMGAIHWATWLSETMRVNTAWDSMWLLGAQGFSTAQLQYFDSKLTRTPAFYVYQMAMKMRGFQYINSAIRSPFGTTTNPDGVTVYFPWVVLRVLWDPTALQLHLFVINQHPTQTYTLTGLPPYRIVSWEQVKGSSYSDGNPLTYGSPSPIKLQVLTKSATEALSVNPISINHIVLE